MLYGGFFVIELCLVVYCALSVIATPEHEVRNLPKLTWLLLVLFFPIVGGIAWLVAGRPEGPTRSLPYKGNTGLSDARRIPAEYDRPGRATAWAPEDDAAYLRNLKKRADEQRKRAEAERREREAKES